MLLIQRSGDFSVGHAGIPHLIDLTHHSGGFFIDYQPVLILVAFTVAVGSVGGQVLAAFLLGVQHRFDFTR